MLLPATLVVPAHIEPRVRVHVQPWLLSSLQLVGGYCGLAVRGDSSHLIAMSRACLADIGSQECKPGDYCFNDVNFTCPPKSTSRADASSYLDCSCNAGYYNASVQSPTSLCQSCLASSYCTGGGSIQACTGNASSPTQSASNASCTCNLGFQGVDNQPCTACASPYFCYSGLRASCPAGSQSPVLSWSLSNCSCVAGRYGPPGAPRSHAIVIVKGSI